MKKIYFSLFALLFSASAFAAGWLQDFSSGRPAIRTESAASDDEWYVTGTGGFLSNSAWKSKANFNYSGIVKPESSFIFLDGTGLPSGTFSLVSPAFTLAAGESLHYKIQEIKVADVGNSVPLEIYVEVATKVADAWVWSTSTTDILASLPNHNIATTAIASLSTDISAYAGQEIRIRFRGIADLGDFAAVFYNVAVLNTTVTDLAISTSQNVPSQIPKRHAGQVLNASVQNFGGATVAATTVTATATGYTATANIPALGTLETAAITSFSPAFAPLSFGDYQLQYTLPADNNVADNEATSNTFAVTPKVFAVDKGQVEDAMSNRQADLGNKFTLTVDDKIESISIGWGKASQTPTTTEFQLVIYALDADGVLNATPVYISETLNRPDNATMPANGGAATFITYPVDQALSAGSYIFTVRSVTYIGVGAEVDNNYVYYSVGYGSVNRDDEGILSSTAGYNLLIRVNTAGIAVSTYYPAKDAIDVELSTAIRFELNQSVDPSSTLAGITVNGNSVTATIGAGIRANRVTISTAGLTPFTENTLCTVVVPAGAIVGYDEEIRWSFTTFKPLAAETYVPANDAQTVPINTEISIEFNKNFNINGWNPGEISITPTGGAALSGVTYAIDAENPKKLVISHADPLLPNTEYTVNVPNNVVATYNGISDWKFTTSQGTGLQAIENVNGVYPTVTQGDITVVSEPGSLIKIVDITGSVRAILRSVDRQSAIRLSDADGLYFVLIENSQSTSTYKVVLQK
ncbi:MAG: Ig-like domain-containing protein [Prevotellaceae bacterium]|jgi:hypothetical protein|nr:Ig-like domain-containing protein [Prevotellaceae bacterium]